MVGNLPFVHGGILDSVADSLLKPRAHPEGRILILSWIEIETSFGIPNTLLYLGLGGPYPDAGAMEGGATNQGKAQDGQ
ncbi:MAG: hypothetical protein EBS53_18060 [Bacteroidetes bacterium]|nr:hypothetical protein [Bacteroidota bacterium]